MRIRLAALLLAVLAAGPACSQAANARPQLPTTLDAAWREMARISPLPLDVRSAQTDWLADGSDGDTAGQLQRLQERITIDRRARALRVQPSDLEKSCLRIELDGCTPLSGGFLKGDGFTLYWQVQDGFTEADGVGGGVVVLEQRGSGPLVPLVWTAEGSAYEAPVLTRVQEDEWLLILPGVSRGTGAGDMMRMMVLRNGIWRQVDTDWQSRAAALLTGREVRHRPYWSFHDGIRAISSLWNPTDPGCCGQAGTALLEFEVADDRLSLTDLKLLGGVD